MARDKKFQKKKQIKSQKWSIPFEKSNFSLMGIGIFTLIFGFYVMTFKPWDSIYALVISPIILAIGYFIIFLIGILKKSRKE